MHFNTCSYGVLISRSIMSRRGVIISFAVSPPKRIIPSRILLSSDISFLSVNSKACDKSSTDRLYDFFSTTLFRIKEERASIFENGEKSLFKNASTGAAFLEN